ncbi:MAG: diguanylate cyclase [Lachnospiraceae bacterium]|nr:diguanylate cyclase [Lachnospiraceae bacterium]
MKDKSLNYYGYEKTTYDDCGSLIAVMNRRHMEILNIWFIIITAIYLFFSWQNSYGFSEQNAPFFLVFLVGEIIFEVIVIRFSGAQGRFLVLSIYFNIITLFIFGTICSAAQPYMAATIYLVILAIIALSYIGTMLGMTVTLLIACTAFLIVSYLVKPGSIFKQDVFNVLIVLMLSVVLHYTFQRMHIRQFITYRESTRMQQELEIKSSFDALTSLLNRGRFFSMAGEVIRQERNAFTVLGLMDLDRFKQINDTLGHQMGDKVIQMAGKTILEELKIDYGDKWSFPERAISEGMNFAGRLGGDEFVVIIRNMNSEEEIRQIFERMLSSLNGVRMEGLDGIHASIGVTRIRPEDNDVDLAYSRADEALYISKESGRNQITFDNNGNGGSGS